jgi:hypothetical protein
MEKLSKDFDSWNKDKKQLLKKRKPAFKRIFSEAEATVNGSIYYSKMKVNPVKNFV